MMSLWRKKVAYEQLKPVKTSALHWSSVDLESDSSTDTDVDLLQSRVMSRPVPVAVRAGCDNVPLEKKVAYEQPKPVKTSAFHRPLVDLGSDSSTDTDVELLQREGVMSSPVASPQPDTKIFGNQAKEQPNREDDITVIGYKPKAVRQAMCLPPVPASLQTSELETMIHIIENREWLTDDHMNHCQALLKHQFPEVDGLQSCAVFEAVGHNFVGTPSGKFVQILNIKTNHWITVSNIHCSNEGEIKIYDSLMTNIRESHCQKFLGQLGWLLHTSRPAITIEWLDVQQQKGSDAWWLYAIANAYALCAKSNPENCAWAQNLLPDWLVGCLLRGTMSSPLMIPRESKGIINTEVEQIYCTCRLPKDRTRPMVACILCNNWYHLNFEVFPSFLPPLTTTLLGPAEDLTTYPDPDTILTQQKNTASIAGRHDGGAALYRAQRRREPGVVDQAPRLPPPDGWVAGLQQR